jgi:hypothetical protein
MELGREPPRARARKPPVDCLAPSPGEAWAAARPAGRRDRSLSSIAEVGAGSNTEREPLSQSREAVAKVVREAGPGGEA